jgi:hypothetical protein
MGLPKRQIRSIGTIQQHEHEDLASARRVLLVDQDGNYIDDQNPLPISGTINVAVDSADTPTIFNLSVPLANTEYSQVLPNNTKKLLIKSRVNNAKLQFAFESGESATNFITVPFGAFYESDGLLLVGKTLFIRSTLATTIEVLAWT